MVSSHNAGPAYVLDVALPRVAAVPKARAATDTRYAARAAVGSTAPALRGGASSARTPHMADIDPLIKRAQAGDQRALRELFERHRGDVSRVAFRVIGPSADLEDVVQEALVQLYRSLPSYRGDSKFSTWLYRVVTNVARMHVRRERARPALNSGSKTAIDRLSSEGGRPDAAAERNERMKALYAYLSQLTEKKRTVLVLHDLTGVSATEIAEIVGAPVLTVRTRLFYARKELYAALARDPALSDLLGALRGSLAAVSDSDGDADG